MSANLGLDVAKILIKSEIERFFQKKYKKYPPCIIAVPPTKGTLNLQKSLKITTNEKHPTAEMRLDAFKMCMYLKFMWLLLGKELGQICHLRFADQLEL